LINSNGFSKKIRKPDTNKPNQSAFHRAK